MLVLGGYGFFGTRICTALAGNQDIHLLVAGRDAASARAWAAQLGLPPRQALALDAAAPDLARRLAELGVDTLIHTAGPFQGQDYHVARAAIALANRLAGATNNDTPLPRGAMPCVGLLTVENYLAALQGYDVTEVPA